MSCVQDEVVLPKRQVALAEGQLVLLGGRHRSDDARGRTPLSTTSSSPRIPRYSQPRDERGSTKVQVTRGFNPQKGEAQPRSRSRRGFIRTRRFTFLPLLVLPLVCNACVIILGPHDDASETGPSKPSLLPDPIEGPMDEPVLDDAQQARKEEAERYTAEVIYQGGEILTTIQLPSGDILDFINRDTLPALPNAIPSLPFSPADLVLPPGVEFGLTELEQSPELLELAATATPFHRPTFWPYILGEAPDATSIEDYLARYELAGEPEGVSRLYAGLGSNEPNRGVSGYMNQFRPEVALKTFSLIEFAVGCPADAPLQEMVGVAISVSKVGSLGINRKGIYDGEPRLHIEYAHMVEGELQYRWNGLDGQFVANPIRNHHPGQKVPVSVLDKTVLEHHIAIFQAPTGDWWIAYNGDLLGYYPANLFTQLNGGACTSAWYGEVARLEATQGNIKTEMGSGRFAEEGLLAAAHVRNPTYYDLLWAPLEPKVDLWQEPKQPLCYSRMPLMHLAAPWDSSFFFLGGPGGKNPGCKWP